MRWLPFFILAYVTLGVQYGLGGFISYRGAAPSLLLVVVLFVAMNAPREKALLAAFLLGLSFDLISAQPLGLYAFTYGLAGLLAAGARQGSYGDHPLTHFFLALGTALFVAIVLWIHGLIRPPGQPIDIGTGETLPALHVSAGVLLLAALYTAVIAPPLLWALNKLKPAFGFKQSRSRYY